MAIVRVGKFSNLALQRRSVHVNLFVHWTSAVNKGDTQMADFLFARFPEPLEAATLAGGPPALSRSLRAGAPKRCSRGVTVGVATRGSKEKCC